MKRLAGGMVLLNLTAISLGLTSGQVDITDEEVLQELAELRSFIDVGRDFSKGFKSLKPVLIEYRSSASSFNGIALANMAFHTDALHMSIGCLANNAGKYLNIDIEVVYEWTDYVGYTVKSAKLNAYEKTAITGASVTGDVDITGDVAVTGDVAIDGDLTADSIVENMEGYAYNAYTELPNLNVSYAGVVKTGNKITFVLSFDFTTEEGQTSVNASTIGSFTVPSDVLDHLIPMTAPFTGYLDIKQLECFASDSGSVKGVEYAYKQVSSIEFNCKISGLTAETKYFCRIEKTFLLSDSLATAGE